MKLSKDKLKQIIKEEADKLLEARTPAYSDYEMDDISTDHQMVSLLTIQSSLIANYQRRSR